MEYTVIIKRKALKFLATVPKRDYTKLREHIEDLSHDPHPAGSIKLTGEDNIYRYRYGIYRILYTVENAQLIVNIIEIGHRKNIYD